MKVYITHYSSKETSLPFKKLCNICSSDESFAEQLLDHQKIDLAAYAEMLNLTAPIIISDKKHFKDKCSSIKLSELMNVSEEAFALLLMENCFSQWKWIAEAKFKAHTSSTNTPSCSTSSTTISLTDDHSKSNTGPAPNSPSKSVQCSATPQIQSPLSQESACSSIGGYDTEELPDNDVDEENYTQISPGYKYQYSQVRRDNKLGAGPWTREGMKRYNIIVQKVIAARKVRQDFEEHLMSHFKEKQKKEPLILKKRKHKWSDQDKDDGGPRKVAVIDLFTIAEI